MELPTATSQRKLPKSGRSSARRSGAPSARDMNPNAAARVARASHERQDLARFAEWRPRLEQGAERIEFGAQRAHVTGVWVEHPG